jgi:hypothetical protein
MKWMSAVEHARLGMVEEIRKIGTDGYLGSETVTDKGGSPLTLTRN